MFSQVVQKSVCVCETKEFWPFASKALLGLAKEIAKTAKTGVVGVANYDVIENFDFEKLTRSNEVTGDFDVGLGWSRLTARMIVRDDDCGGARHDS
ncbi:hypothetical protein SDC9_146261 [bioreactor metagenome]|uniref:Uncharacterized protein n=1 Tax=bioreactor metagenome TaxID=1076179 RepID=A0A645ECJ9_9ZZZZ